MKTVFLSLGSNLGNRMDFLHLAKNAIETHIGTIFTCSSVYETEPWGFDSLNLFLNQVVVAATELQPQEILKTIHSIEKDLGRIHSKQRYSERTIDLDILFYDDLIYTSAELTIPHPEIQNRRFILEPLAEIAADMIHPALGINITGLLAKCEDKCVVVRHFNP
jgi:2-amino-4-hydroxy-6-hydroxymethyldihydropteridine diphosphokinase